MPPPFPLYTNPQNMGVNKHLNKAKHKMSSAQTQKKRFSRDNHITQTPVKCGLSQLTIHRLKTITKHGNSQSNELQKKDFLHQRTRLASSSALCRFVDGLSLSSSMIASSELQDTIWRTTVSSPLRVDSAEEFASWELLDKTSLKSVAK